MDKLCGNCASNEHGYNDCPIINLQFAPTKIEYAELKEIVKRVRQFKTKYDELIKVTDYAPKMVDTHAAWIGTHEVLEKILEENNNVD